MLLSAFAFAAMAEQWVKTTGDVNYRSGPGLKYAIKGYFVKGLKVEYAGKTSKDSRGVKWYKIKVDGSTAWVSSKYSKLLGKSSSSSSSSSGDIKAKVNVNIRSGPGTGFKVLGSLPKGKSAKYLKDSAKDKKGRTWYYVSYGSVKGWVCGSYVKKK